MDDDKPATPEEQAAATALAEALDGKMGAGAKDVDAADVAAMRMIRAAAGREAPLGELRARGISRAAVEESRRAVVSQTPDRAARRRSAWTAGALAATAAVAAAVIVALAPAWRPARTAPIPVELASRSAGLLVPGPFPAGQTAAERLDVVTADRLVALREVRLRAVAAGRGRQ